MTKHVQTKPISTQSHIAYGPFDRNLNAYKKIIELYQMECFDSYLNKNPQSKDRLEVWVTIKRQVPIRLSIN